MQSIVWDNNGPYPIAILTDNMRKDRIEAEYIKGSINKDACMVLSLHKAPGKKKTPKKEMMDYLNEVFPVLKEHEVQYILCANADYFKALTKLPKAEAYLGYVVPCTFMDAQVVYIPSHAGVMYDPEKVRAQIKRALDALEAHVVGAYEAVGSSIIKHEAYPQSTQEIAQWLDKLLAMDCPLTIDIEAYSLKFSEAGIGTISFAWNEHEGIAFPVDYAAIPDATEAPYGFRFHNEPVRALLKSFFCKYLQKQIYHNIGYDVTVLIYQLFMTEIFDAKGLGEGMDVMLRNWDDTKHISYLATNTCAGNDLSLKAQAQEFAGNYAVEEIKDILKIPTAELLKYNLVDSLSTWYTYNKNHPVMVRDQQENIYETIFKPASVDIIQMQLTGLPLNMKRVKEVKLILEADEASAITRIRGSKVVQHYDLYRREQWAIKKNESYKIKRVTAADCPDAFNPNSGAQVQQLLYESIGLPIINYTDSKQPATDKDTLKALKNHTKNMDVLDLLDALLDLTAVTKILNSFIPAMEAAVYSPSMNWHFLCGFFNLGGTLSGRLSSSKPNLQNIPATGSKYAKLIKSCFMAPDGWIFAGLDFASLEDRISALTTKDPNKLKVYTDGYDGHSLRAHSYFGDQMPDIQIFDSGKAFKVIFEDGTEEIFHESQPGMEKYLKYASLA